MEAIFVKDLGGKWSSEAKLYALSRPVIDFRDWEDRSYCASWVVVSAVRNAFDHGGPETFVFLSDKDGEPLHWGEQEGSIRGEYNHQKALDGFLAAHKEPS